MHARQNDERLQNYQCFFANGGVCAGIRLVASAASEVWHTFLRPWVSPSIAIRDHPQSVLIFSRTLERRVSESVACSLCVHSWRSPLQALWCGCKTKVLQTDRPQPVKPCIKRRRHDIFARMRFSAFFHFVSLCLTQADCAQPSQSCCADVEAMERGGVSSGNTCNGRRDLAQSSLSNT